MRFIAITIGMILCIGIGGAFAFSQELIPSDKDYVPYTENYNVPFNHYGNIDYDLLIKKIMPEIFEKKFREQGISISSQDIVLNHGPQILVYQESSSVCGYVIDYSDNQVYWLLGGINSTHIQNAEISTETPKPDVSHEIEIEEYDLMWCFGPLKEQVTLIFLEDKSYLTEKEESIVASAIKHELKGNPNLFSQKFTVGKFNFDYGVNTLSFCGEFQQKKAGLKYFGGTLKNNVLRDFHLDDSLPPLCAMSDDAKIHSIKTNQKSDVPKDLQAWKNIRMETIFVKDSSVERLLERNYMYSKNMNYNMFEYSTPFEIEQIEFVPDNSSTIWNFEKTTKNTFAKIRVPQNGGNYYMAYGPNDWNKGDLDSVSILVNGVEVSYNTQPYIQSPEAPYPILHTDYIFKVPNGTTSITVVLFIENYVPKEIDDKYQPYKPRD